MGIYLAVIGSVAVAAVATPLYRKGYYATHGLQRGTWFDLTEVALGLIFVVEFLIKVVADGFVFAPNAYLHSIWNVIDFLLLVALLVNTTTSPASCPYRCSPEGVKADCSDLLWQV